MKLSETIVPIICALAAAAAGCDGAQNTQDGSELLGSVTVDLSLAPPDARCAVLTVTPETGSPVVRRMPLSPEQAVTFTLGALPTGDVTVTEEVFTVICMFASEAMPTWIADPVTVTLNPSATITFNLRRADEPGQLTAISNFPTKASPIHMINLSAQGPLSVAAGPDDNVWFTDGAGASVTRLAADGSRTSFTVPGSVGMRIGPITAGPDGQLWFGIADPSAGPRIGRISTSGTVTEIDLPASVQDITHITTGHDGNIWFTDVFGNQIDQYSMDGVLTRFNVPTPNALPSGIAAGTDGNIWFTEESASQVGRITPTGTVTEFTTLTPNAVPDAITSGPDGSLWFVEKFVNQIGRITTSGTMTELTIPTGATFPESITSGSDGNLWMTESTTAQIARITPGGIFTEFALPDIEFPVEIISGPGGNIVFTTLQANLGQVQLPL